MDCHLIHLMEAVQMSLQCLLSTCFITLLHGLSSNLSHGGSSNESTVFAFYLFNNSTSWTVI